MRPPAPEFFPQEPDQTPTETPFAREVRAALRGPLARLRRDFDEAIEELTAQVTEALVNTTSPQLLELRRDRDYHHGRLVKIERILFPNDPPYPSSAPTEPSPPPAGAE